MSLSCRAQRIHSRTKSSFPQQRVLLHFPVSLQSGSASTRVAPGFRRGLHDVTAGLRHLSRTCRGYLPSLPMPSIAVRCPAASGKTHWHHPWSLLPAEVVALAHGARGREGPWAHRKTRGQPERPHLPGEHWGLHP